MFSLKVDKDLIERCVEGITLDTGDKLTIKYLGLDGRTIEKEDVRTIKTIIHYNGPLFSVTFEEEIGEFVYSLNQLIHFKID